MKDPYSILGVSSSASDEEIKTAYRALARKYHPDNYGDDNPLKELANEKMQEINEAYDKIQKMRSSGASSDGGTYYDRTSSSSSRSGIYYEIRQALNSRRFAEAERKLANVPICDRTADWHFLNSVLLYNKGYINDSMRELEMACSMDPANDEYQQFKTMFNTSSRGYGSTYYGGGGGGYYRRRSDADEACDCCTKLICLDCLCECMGGDLIRCL